MSTYFFRPVLPGTCAECDEPYPAWERYMHLTAKGIVHPDCDDTPLQPLLPDPRTTTTRRRPR